MLPSQGALRNGNVCLSVRLFICRLGHYHKQFYFSLVPLKNFPVNQELH